VGVLPIVVSAVTGVVLMVRRLPAHG